nr:hypothetical protein MIMGU_mgv1a016496mg [Ipomoea batatas]
MAGKNLKSVGQQPTGNICCVAEGYLSSRDTVDISHTLLQHVSSCSSHDGLVDTHKIPTTVVHKEPIIQSFIKGLQPVAKLSHLSSEDGVFSLNIEIMLGGEAHAGDDLTVLFPQMSHLEHQIIQMLLFPHPRPPRRFTVRYHSLPFPLIHQLLKIPFRT